MITWYKNTGTSCKSFDRKKVSKKRISLTRCPKCGKLVQDLETHKCKITWGKNDLAW